VFIGPADLSAALGHRGRPDHPEVQTVMEGAVAQALAAGKAVGSLLSDETLARKYISLGCTFMAVGVDTTLLARGAHALAARYKDAPSATGTGPGGGY
jgi:4-hydroxy-2-oxoheptanedioate aldolase